MSLILVRISDSLSLQMSYSRTISLLMALLAMAPTLFPETALCPTQTILVTVLNNKQEVIISDLGPANFRARIGGKPADVASAQMVSTAPWTVLVLDSSTSMLSGANEWQATLQYAAGLIDSAPVKDRVALVVFAGRVTSALGFGAGSAKLKQAISDLQQEPRRRSTVRSDGTALFDALAAAAELVPAGQDGVLVALTDGMDTKSKKQFPEVRALLLNRRLRLFAFMLVRPPYSSIEERQSLRNFSDLVEQTGGLSIAWGEVFMGSAQAHFDLSPDGLNQLNASATSLNTIITHPYSLRLQAATERPERLKLQIVDGAGKKRVDLLLSYPQEMGACSKAATPASH